jgi:polysaccharide export outer membrane protein
MLAIAGGIAPTGGDIVILTGARNGKPLRKVIDVAGMFLDGKLEEDIVVAGGDVIYVSSQPLFYIYGQVQRPGSYRVERGMTVRQALAQGGGPTLRGTERGLRAFRRSAGGQIESSNPEPGDRVLPNDVLYVQESLF